MNKLDYFRKSSEVIKQLAAEFPGELQRLVTEILQAWESGGKVISFGNGGSAGDSLHFTTELVARFKSQPIHQPAVSLAGNPCTVTAVANDWSFDELFSRQIKAIGTARDVYLGRSTSGDSENVVRGLQEGLHRGGKVFALTGSRGGRISELEVELIAVPASVTAHIQEAHIVCLHWVCEQIDAALNG